MDRQRLVIRLNDFSGKFPAGVSFVFVAWYWKTPGGVKWGLFLFCFVLQSGLSEIIWFAFLFCKTYLCSRSLKIKFYSACISMRASFFKIF